MCFKRFKPIVTPCNQILITSLPLHFQQKSDLGDEIVLVFITVNDSYCHGSDYSPSLNIQLPNSTGERAGGGREGVWLSGNYGMSKLFISVPCRRNPL